MNAHSGIVLGPLVLSLPNGSPPLGADVLRGLVGLAEAATGKLHQWREREGSAAAAVVGRLRGTGRGVSFIRLINELERAFPLELHYPFEGSDRVRSVPARERDVFLFTRGTVHTFSTGPDPMMLLSCQLPFLPFDDPRQYRLPAVRWTAKEHRHDDCPAVGCDPAWSVLAQCHTPTANVFLEVMGVGTC